MVLHQTAEYCAGIELSVTWIEANEQEVGVPLVPQNNGKHQVPIIQKSLIAFTLWKSLKVY